MVHENFWGLFMKKLVGLSLIVLAMSSSFAHAKVKIGFILSTMQEERYQRDKAVFTETIQKLGGDVVFASCNNNEQTQAAQVDNLLSQGVKVLVIQPVNGDTAAGLVKQAKEDGVAVVDYDRLIKNAPIDFYVTEDSEKVGQLQAEAAVKALGGKGNVVLLMGQAGHSVAEARTRGVLKVLEKNPGMKIVVKQYHHGWSPNLAMTTTENALSKHGNNIQAIIANNSGMAHGAIQAVTEQKLTGKIFVAGADADLAAIRDIVAGKQQFEVLISIQDMAAAAANAAWSLANNQKPASNTSVENGTGKISTMNTPVFAVSKDNIEKQIISTGFHSKKAVYGSN